MSTAKFRHGDLVIRSQSSIPSGAKKLTATAANGKFGYVLARGEVTGHIHMLEAPEKLGNSNIEAYEAADGTIYLSIKSSAPAALTHEEHAKIELPTGVFSVNVQREYQPDGWRYVAD